jgi:hypothetical protein
MFWVALSVEAILSLARVTRRVVHGEGGCPPGCAGDVFPIPGGDGVTNIDDLLLVINNWG